MCYPPSTDAFPEPLVPDASRPSSSDKTQRVNVRPAELPPSSPLMSGGDEEGGHRATLADLMKHARHDGKGMVSPLKLKPCVCVFVFLCACIC